MNSDHDPEIDLRNTALHKNFKIPPTGVVGWFRSFLQSTSFIAARSAPEEKQRAVTRKDLNERPTPVGGILTRQHTITTALAYRFWYFDYRPS